MSTESIPNGYCSVPVNYINLKTGEIKKIHFKSGFFRVNEDNEGFLSPKIGWCVEN